MRKETNGIQPQSTIPKWLHTLLMVASVAVVLRWLWGWFGPGKEAVRRQAESFSQMLPLDFKGLLFLGIAIVAAGYLCWRLLTWFFWRKYFGDQDPPGDDNSWM